MRDAPLSQLGVQIGRMERALAGLGNHDLSVARSQRFDKVVSRLAVDKNAPHRPVIADAQPVTSPARSLARRTIGQIRAMAFLGMNDGEAGFAERSEQPRHGFHGRLEMMHFVTERRAKPARLDEIALHVDDHERELIRTKDVFVGVGGDRGESRVHGGVLRPGTCRRDC